MNNENKNPSVVKDVTKSVAGKNRKQAMKSSHYRHANKLGRAMKGLQ